MRSRRWKRSTGPAWTSRADASCSHALTWPARGSGAGPRPDPVTGENGQLTEDGGTARDERYRTDCEAEHSGAVSDWRSFDAGCSDGDSALCCAEGGNAQAAAGSLGTPRPRTGRATDHTCQG